MLEPKPAKVELPRDKEPVLRIGVILEEDRKTDIRIKAGNHVFFGDGASFKPESGRTYRLSSHNGYLVLSRKEVVCLECNAPIYISNESLELSERSGLEVDGVVAGRAFHWRKEITQTLPGNLEIHLAPDGSIVLANVLKFEDYISCVIASEMAAACPPDFIRAQAVAARSWALAFLGHKHTGKPYTICNDDDCQRYQGTTHIKEAALAAIEPCRGEFLIADDGFVCPAYYAKSCGGHTEEPRNMFGFDVPGITARTDRPERHGRPPQNESAAWEKLNLAREEDFKTWLSEPSLFRSSFCSPSSVPESDLKRYLGAVDEEASYYRWQYSIEQNRLAEILRNRRGLKNLEEVVELAGGPRGPSGRLKNLTIHYLTKDGAVEKHLLEDNYEIRRALHESFLFSSAFEWDYERTEDRRISKFNFRGAGWGHGVGLCQIGAVGMALQGYNYKQILKHYYPGAKVKKGY